MNAADVVSRAEQALRSGTEVSIVLRETHYNILCDARLCPVRIDRTRYNRLCTIGLSDHPRGRFKEIGLPMESTNHRESKHIEIRTLGDLTKAQGPKFETSWFPKEAEMVAWDTIEKHIGRRYQEDISLRSLRKLRVEVADVFDLKIFSMNKIPLVEFAEMCDRAFGKRSKRTARSRRRPGRPQKYDPKQDARLADAWEVCGCRTFQDAARQLSERFSDLTAEKLERAVRRHNKRRKK